MLLLILLIKFVLSKIPPQFEEVVDGENLLFTVLQPYHLAYTYQMKHAYMLGGQFNQELNRTMKNLDLVQAFPVQACTPLEQKFHIPTAVLIERGGCSFTDKANHAQEAGAALVMVTDSEWGSRREYVNMIPDASLRIVDIPCVYIASATGRNFREFFEDEDYVIKMDIPVEKLTTPWIHHQRKAPWEYWGEDTWLF